MNAQHLRETLECPVCFHLRRGPIYICINGHSVCGACHAKLPAAPAKLCPLARCDFDQPPRRNLTAEEIVRGGGVAVDCDNPEQGCLVTGVGKVMEEHLLECPYREVPCPKTSCQARVRLHKLANHLNTSPDHGILMASGGINWDRSVMVSEGTKVDWELPAPQQKNGVIFYRQVAVRDGFWFAWVAVVGGGKEAARWTCDVSVGDIAARNQQVHPIDRTVGEVLESGEYLSLAGQQARKLARTQEAGCFKIWVNYAITEK